MDQLLQNLRLGVRSLLRTPSFTLTATATLALGIGLATAVFTVAEALLLRRLPVRDQDRLLVLSGETRDGAFPNHPLSLISAREFSRSSRALEQVTFTAYEGAWPVMIRDEDQVSRLRRALVSGNFFAVIGVRPSVGRFLHEEDDRLGAAPVMVLSHAAWLGRFGADPSVIGRSVLLHETGTRYTIVGVAPRGFDYPRGADFWTPIVPARTREGTDSVIADVLLIGRLRRDAQAAHARDDLTAFFARPDASPWMRDLRGTAHSFSDAVLGDTRPALIAFSAAALLLLVLTCINVANLLLLRGLARLREVAVRSALGAERSRIVLQLLTENALLALAGGVLGLALAAGAVQVFVAMAPSSLPRLDEISVDIRAVAAGSGITALAVLLFAIAPALVSTRIAPQQALRSDPHLSSGRRSRIMTEALVMGQIALAVLVLSGAAVIGRSLVKLERAELSLEPSRLLIGELAIRFDQFADRQKQVGLLDRLLEHVSALPGVRAVSPVVAVPFSGSGGWDGRFAADHQSVGEAAANPMLNLDVVTPSWFETFGIPVVRGRAFTEADREGAPPVIVVSASTARHYWPGADPIGRRLRMGHRLEHEFTVVGVVPDARYRDLRVARPSIYFPLRQSIFPFVPLTLAIRTSGPPAAVVPLLRQVIAVTDPGVALARADPFETYLRGPLAQPRLNALLLGIFALAAVGLAAVGLFGVMATMVRQRTHEFGIRMALGATGSGLRRLVLKRGLLLGSMGALVGLLGALGLNRLLTSLLYDLSPTDGWTLAVVAGVLLLVATAASFIPAGMSTRVDPLIALRADQ